MGYPKPVYDRVWEELARRRLFSREENERRKEEIRGALPCTEEIEREMSSHGASLIRLIIADPAQAEERILELSSRNLALQGRRAELLSEAGYPHDYLEIRHICSSCKDSGYIGRDICHCMESLLRKEAAAQLGGTSPVDNCSFENFSLEYYPAKPDESGVPPRDRMKDVFSACRRWAEKFSPRGGSILLIGKPGLGKTHLSSAMAKEISAAGFGVIYTPVQRMMDALETEKFSYGEQRTAALATYIECDLLVLDDLGTEFTTQFTAAALFNVINTRLVEKRPTIISTNLEISEIKSRYSPRMASRLICDYATFPFAGKDIRYIRKMNSKK